MLLSIALVSTKHQHESVMEMFAHVPSHLTLLPFFISILEVIMFLVSAIKAHVPGLEFIFELSITCQSHLSKLWSGSFKLIKKSGNILRQRESFVDFSFYLFHLGHIKTDELQAKYYFLTPKACLNAILTQCLWFLSCQ